MEIPLDETLAGPLIAKVKAEAEARVQAEAKKAAEAEDKAREQADAVAARERAVAERESSVQAQVDKRVAEERLAIREKEREALRLELAPEIQSERERAKKLEADLATAQANELRLRQEKDALDQRARSLDLEIARKVDEQRVGIQEQAAKDADESYRLKMAEKDLLIRQLTEQADELKRKGTQGSQQAQGDVLELDFEAALRSAFPQDLIEPVKTGAYGGDILQRVLGNMGRPVGTILWEAKRAQSWGGDWCGKAKKDAADAKAEVAVIVSEVLPKGLCDFGPQDGVWTVRPSHAVMLGVALREGLMATAEARLSASGRETKMERLYAYMTGPEFRSTLEGIALPFRELHEELLAEKRATLARWRRQERRIERVLTSVAGLQGDLQGIAGSEMAELPGFQYPSERDSSDRTMEPEEDEV
ncbi:MAG: DUF2130 domain-containing protein [Armatimonadetes bacterium]|nr:DUF2130 domain-containing protein [Armatimonadota bacterium]